MEITGPVERKMIINALNSGARMFMADFEDSSTPSWDNMVRGQINLRQAVDGTISFTSLEGKGYSLNEKTATLIVRPRGWHLLERHVLVDGEPSPPRSSTSASSSSTTPSGWSRREAAPTSTCRRSRATSRRASGTTCLTRPSRA